MLISKLNVLRSHGKQFIPDLQGVRLPDTFRGRPRISGPVPDGLAGELAALCPSGAIGTGPFSVDLGRCVFCNECAMRSPQHIVFTPDYRLASNDRRALVVREDSPEYIAFEPDEVRECIRRLFGRALKLRQVSAGGDNATEMELNASMNVNFDFARFGIDFVASPRHADGVVVTGPLTENMARALEICYHSVPAPRLVILAGSDAVSGGLFAGSGALNRNFLDRFGVDLYIPGNPVHPLTFIDGVMTLLGHYRREPWTGTR